MEAIKDPTKGSWIIPAHKGAWQDPLSGVDLVIAGWGWNGGELKDTEAGHRSTYLGVSIFNWQQEVSAVSQLLQDLGILKTTPTAQQEPKCVT